MQQRIEWHTLAPDAYKAMRGVQEYVNNSGLEHSLLELVKARASQINGCAYCLDMHTQDARAAGETEQRLYTLVAWRETTFFTERERAALAWCEALTLVADGHVPDDVYREVLKHFNEKELVDLSMVIVAINGWNRLAIAFRVPVGSYKARRQAAAQ